VALHFEHPNCTGLSHKPLTAEAAVARIEVSARSQHRKIRNPHQLLVRNWVFVVFVVELGSWTGMHVYLKNYFSSLLSGSRE